MGLFDDLDIEDFSYNVPYSSYKRTYTHRFKPERFGFATLDADNDRFFRNMFGDTRYYLRKKYVFNGVDEWMFKIMSKNNDLLHQEIFTDTDITLRLPRLLRREVIKDIIDLNS